MTIAIIGDWRGLALRGVAAVLFGVLALIWPGITLLALVLLFGAWALVDGVAVLVSLARGRTAPGEPRWALALEAVVGIGIGIVTFAWPGITALALVILIGARAFIVGLLELIAAVRLRRVIDNEWLLVLGGLVSIAFAVAVFISPGAGALAITWLIGWFAIFWGALMLGLSWRARRVQVGFERPMRSMRGARGAHA
jgi:uncharacterized membrane protein HdeD (DUF308 family)